VFSRAGVMLLLLLIALPGCGHRTPSARVHDATITARTEQGLVVAFLVEIENPNRHPIPLHEARYQVALGRGGLVVPGALGEVVGVVGGGNLGGFENARVPLRTVPPNTTVSIELPVAIPASARLQQALEAGEGDAIEVPYTFTGLVIYRRPGEIAERLFDARLVRPRARFSDRGRIVLEPE